MVDPSRNGVLQAELAVDAVVKKQQEVGREVTTVSTDAAGGV